MGWEPHQLEHLKYSAAQIFYFNFNQSNVVFNAAQPNNSELWWSWVSWGESSYSSRIFSYAEIALALHLEYQSSSPPCDDARDATILDTEKSNCSGACSTPAGTQSYYAELLRNHVQY